MVIFRRTLDRKMLRDLWSMRMQSLAIVLIMGSGVATFVMSFATLDSLATTQRRYYEQTRFADVFVRTKRTPNHISDRIARLPGVARADTRIVLDVTLDVPDLIEPAIGRLISVPEHGQPDLNRLHLRQGRWIASDRADEAMVNEQFAEAHGLTMGDTVPAVVNGRRQELRIVGIVLSPEYVIAIGGGSFLPDTKRFGVFWVGRRMLEAAYDMEGAFNDLSLTLTRGATEQEVLRRIDLVTETYGGVGAYGRADQLSHNFVTEEIHQLRNTGYTSPVIFLSVAAFLLHVVFSRTIRTQREQIAVLKAFGYTRTEVAIHYAKLVGAVVAVGLALGVGLGAWMGEGLTRLYTQFYRFPTFHFDLNPRVVAGAALVTILAAGAGTLGAVRRAMQLPPAEAMRPEPPAVYRRTLFERIGAQRWLAQSGRMILRKLEREPIKAAMSCVGLAMAVAVLVLGNFMNDALDEIIISQYERAQRQDVMITFVEPSSAQAFYDSLHLPGVSAAEPFRRVSVRLRAGARHERVGLLGLPPDRRLFRLIDADNRVVELPPRGLLMSAKLAELLDVVPGDRVIVEVMEGERPTRQIAVATVIDDIAGTNAYMNLDALRRLMREGDTVSGAYLAVDPSRLEDLYRELKKTPAVASVTATDAAVRSFDESIAENQRRMLQFIVGFAVVIAFGVVYNTARVTLAERERELATMRVLGFSSAEVSMVLLGEMAILTAIAIPLGLLMGYGLAALSVSAFETEMYRIPLIVSRQTLGFAAAVTIVAAFASGMVVRKRIDRLDLIGVLKSRE